MRGDSSKDVIKSFSRWSNKIAEYIIGTDKTSLGNNDLNKFSTNSKFQKSETNEEKEDVEVIN